MLHAGISGSQLVVIEGAGHTLIWTHGNELMRVTHEFLGPQSGGGSSGKW